MTGDGGGEPAKILLPVLQRADELQKHDHLVAYYCRLYAMEKGLKIPAKERTKNTNALLASLMNQLEKDKTVVKLSSDDNMHMEGFALGVFAKADKQDRAGRADANTAKSFYAASIFFEVLLQFGELQTDILEKQKYAAWKAVDIHKALSEGRKPVPGPPVDDSEGDPWNPEVSKIVSTNVAPEIPSISSPVDRNWENEGSGSMEQSSQGPPLSDTSTPLEHPSHQSSNAAAYDEINLPPVPSPPAYPSYGHDYYAPAGNLVFPSSSPPSDQSNFYSQAPPFSTAGTYSYATDQPGPTSSGPPSFISYPSNHDAAGSPQASQPGYNPQQNWSSSPFNNPPQPPSYPSFFPPGGSGYHSAAPQYPSATHETQDNPAFTGVRPSHARTASAPSAPDLSAAHNTNEIYDSNYEPSPAQVAEAHKMSRFAVSALAFDDIPTAISYLQKSLEALTSPSGTS
jgi:vacuolar protein sorting-associated protein VTA1